MEQELAMLLRVTFRDPSLLQIALTHRSYWHEMHNRTGTSIETNERFEFLGDAVLNFLATSWLFRRFPALSEGELSTLRAKLVQAASLSQIAQTLSLGRHVRIGRGEEKNGGRERESILSNTFEAILAAVYLDQGLDAAQQFLEPLLEQQLQQIEEGNEALIDYRTQLQQLLQSHHGIDPAYRTIQMTGPEHCRQFTVEVLKGEEPLGTGYGASKQAAAQEAARTALETLKLLSLQ